MALKSLGLKIPESYIRTLKELSEKEGDSQTELILEGLNDLFNKKNIKKISVDEFTEDEKKYILDKEIKRLEYFKNNNMKSFNTEMLMLNLLLNSQYYDINIIKTLTTVLYEDKEERNKFISKFIEQFEELQYIAKQCMNKYFDIYQENLNSEFRGN